MGRRPLRVLTLGQQPNTTVWPSGACRPREIATTLPFRPSRDAAPFGTATTPPSLPSREFAPRGLATTRPSRPSRHVAPCEQDDCHHALAYSGALA